ncbi:tectonic [Drosophila innubila]|uniref:tectonic n=1 Tax=Drosophila innubila TaxID=198719 RepID=UPI00148E8465|nr:tectonic [Drosophila innubila]
MSCVKIGISQTYNTSSTSTTTTTTTEIAMTTNNIDVNTTGSPWPEEASTPAQTFPPRKTQKPPTTAVPRQRTTTPVTGTDATKSKNVTTGGITVTSRKDYGFYYCDCDLHADLCEINCCCDRDCPTQTMQVFNCLQSSVAPQLQTRLEDFQYTHGLPTCQLHDGWLCVFRSNTKPAKLQLPSNNFDADQYKKWPELISAFEEQLMPAQLTAHYKFGQALQLWQPESKHLCDFELPMAYESSNCQLKQTLRHLAPMQSNCLMSDATEMQSHLWTLLNLTSSHQLLTRPRDLEDQDVQGIDIEICQQLLIQPQVLCGNGTHVDIMVDSVELQLMHNYTHILAAKLLLKEARLQEENEELWLRYELIYKTATDELAKPSSGPLGYLQGSPLLLATLQPQNSSDKKNSLSYFHKNVTQRHHHWLTLCQNSVVNFGVDLSKKCQLRQLTPVHPEHGNHTDYCKQLQVHIWRKLLPHNCTQLDDLGQIFVSQLGRPQLDKWLPLQLDAQQMLPIQGIYNEEQQSLSCRNMLLSVSYEFHVAEMTLLEGQVPHQNVLQHAKLVLGQRHDLELDAAEQLVELPLSVSVMFFKARLNSGYLPILSSGLLTIFAITWLHLLT